MTVVSTYWVGPGTLDTPQVVEVHSKGQSSIMILSGSSMGTLLFVAGAQVVLAIVLLYLKLFIFAAAFFSLGIAVAIAGYGLRGIKFCFEQKWLSLSEAGIVFKDGVCWAKPELRHVGYEIEQIPNGNGGDSPGWVIKFINQEDEEQHYQFVLKSDFKTFWDCVQAWDAPNNDKSNGK